MNEAEYKACIDENPLLMRRPDLITDVSQNTRDFKIVPPPVIEE
jgi:hypothetical protein